VLNIIYSVYSLVFGHLIFLSPSGHFFFSDHAPAVIFTLIGLPQALCSLLFKHQLKCTADYKKILSQWFITHHSNEIASKSKCKGTSTPEK